MKRRTISIILAVMMVFSAGFTATASAVTKPGKVSIKTVKESAPLTIRVDWTKMSGVTGYEIYRNGKKVGTAGSSATYCTHSNLAPGTYKYKLRAYKSYKQKQYYNKHTKKWQTTQPKKKKYRGGTRTVTLYSYGAYSAEKGITLAKPATPSISFVKEPEYGKVTVTWTKPANVSGFEIYRNGAKTARVSGTSYTYTNLTPGTAYTFKVRAYKTYKKTSSSALTYCYGSFSSEKKITTSKKTGAALAQHMVQLLASSNAKTDYSKGGFTWDTENKSRSWTYYNGLMMKAFIFNGQKAYADRFYSSNISSSGSISGYASGQLDSVECAEPLFYLLDTGNAAKYKKAIQFVYSDLEKQTVIPNTGGNVLHKQNADGTPINSWATYPLALDGLYMSLPFLMDCANAIDDGKITLKDAAGNAVISDDIYQTVYERIEFVDRTFRLNNGLYAHAYNPATKKTNGHTWSRGEGWYLMCLVDVYEKMPESDYKDNIRGFIVRGLDGIIPYQQSSGLWYNVPNRDSTLAQNRLELSGSGMFAYSLLKASKMGINSSSYKTAGDKAINGIQTKIKYTGTAYQIDDIYKASGAGETDDYYCTNVYVSNEAKGVAPIILVLSIK